MQKQQPKSIIERLQQKAPDKGVVFTAIAELKKPAEILQFRAEYEKYLREQGEDEKTRQNAAEVANSNIGYALGYYTKETAGKWFDTLEQISHPVFGREIPFSQPNRAYEAGREAGRTK